MAQIQICRGFGDKDWEALSKLLIKDGTVEPDARAWERAIDIFERRMRERFFLCIEKLEKIPTPDYVEVPDEPNPYRKLPEKNFTTGFAIMALCCLLIETLQLFRAGSQRRTTPKKANPSAGVGEAFVEFLTKRLSFHSDDAMAFYDGIRNGIVHQAETKGWIIRRNEPRDQVVGRKGSLYILNRTLFCDRLEEYFRGYVEELRKGDDRELRRDFAKRMNRVVKKCRKIG